MFQMLTKITRWGSIPVLAIASMFSYFAARYEPLVDVVICLGAIVFIQRAVWLKEYFWAAGLVAIVVVFSPLLLMVKIFLLMGITCIGTFAALFGALRPRALEIL